MMFWLRKLMKKKQENTKHGCVHGKSAFSLQQRSPLRPARPPSSGSGSSFPVSPAVGQRWADSGEGRSRRRRGRGAAGRGGTPRIGRGSRHAAANAVLGETVWCRGDPIVEVCKTDQDVPALLTDLVNASESGRRARRARVLQERQQDVGMNADESDNEDELVDADCVISRELFGGDREAMQFQWSPMANFRGCREEFLCPSGPTVQVQSAYKAFRSFWDDLILEHIVRETNRYAAELVATSERFARDWYETNEHEIMILFAFYIQLGVIPMPSIDSCFSKDPLLKTTVFRQLLTRQRYWHLNKALHFADNSTRLTDSSKLFCLGPLVKHLNAKFQVAYQMEQNISLDESLTLWKNNLSFREYIKMKAARFGFKTLEVCKSTTGYLWSFEVYSGENHSNQSLMPKSTEIVVRLMEPLLNKGHILHMDNRFNSPVLSRYLKRNKTDCVGTLHNLRKKVPALIQLAVLNEGTCVARHSGDVVVMGYKDKKPVYLTSTYHGTELIRVDGRPGRPSHYKLGLIADYNFNMGGVDKKDQMLEPFRVERKRNQKWYKMIFKRFLNVSIFNARIILNKCSAERKFNSMAFRLDLVREIMTLHSAHMPRPQIVIQPSRVGLPNQRLLGRQSHFLGRIPYNAEQKNAPRQRCIWCTVPGARDKKRTQYQCKSCEVPLCLEPCFEEYHTIP